MKTIFKTVGLVGAIMAGSAIATNVSAATVNFSHNDWQPAQGLNTFILNGISVSSSQGGTLNWNDNGHPLQKDGFGINYGSQSDEIDGDEKLLISFFQAVTLNSFSVKDFFASTGTNNAPEQGQYSIDGGLTFTTFTSNTTNSSTNPSQLVNVGQTITTILFQAVDNTSSEFAVHSLDFDVATAPVPLPPAVWLLGSAMVFLFRKRQTS